MDALANYGSDSDDDSSNGGGAATATATTVATTAAEHLLPPPQWDGPAGWIHGHTNYLAADATMTTVPQELSQNNPGTPPSTPPLAQTLRAQQEFSNPQHLVQTVTRLGIADAWGSDSNRSVQSSWQAWERTTLFQREQDARTAQQQQGATAAAAALPASNFVQDQLSRALMGHERSSG